MIYFENAGLYIESKSSIKEKIEAINAIITALLTTAATAATTDHLKEYQLNDGQTIIRQEYMGLDHIEKSIKSFERLKQMYINQYDGSRVTQLMDAKNFTR